MNPNSTQTKRNLKDEADERFVADYLEKQGMKAVKRDAVVLDLRAANDHLTAREVAECAVRTLRESSWVSDSGLADQIEAQTRPPKPAEPTGLGAVVEDAAGDVWVHDRDSKPGYLGVEWLNVRTRAHRRFDDIDVVGEPLSEGVQP